MALTYKRRIVLTVLIIAVVTVAVVVGTATGMALASIQNAAGVAAGPRDSAALPSQLLDSQGRLITEFFAEENRTLVTIDELPKHLIYALITREDQSFFEHRGFSIRGTIRAAWNLVTGRYVSGGSTISQQLAGHLYADRQEFSIARKLRELWWALQLERSLTKYEILEQYLNTMFFGHGTYGVEAASRYYFGHSATELSMAESVMLVIQLANPAMYSPIRRPNEARRMQRTILNRMVHRGYATQEEVDLSFTQYWNDYDFTRASTSTAFFDREDRAPYFSEYVRYRLENELLLGAMDINREGFVVHTTLDLEFQDHADRLMREGISRANTAYREGRERRVEYGDELVPVVEMLSLAFDIDSIRVGDATQRRRAREYYQERLNPVLDIVSLMFSPGDNDGIRHAGRVGYVMQEQQAQRTQVEGALVTIENRTGHIKAMVGGSEFESRNQFNRAVDARLLPGSAFKPLYYAAAIESRAITPATMIYDSPVVFWNDDGSPYTPANFRGEWRGPVLAREALSTSMNVPSLRVLQRVGFTEALNTSARLLGIPERDMVNRNLVRRYPVGLGVASVSPLEMARAFATFANEGRAVEPIAVRYIEDRQGRLVLEHEKEVREEQRRRRGDLEIVTPQTAYIITDMLKSAVTGGTLRYARSMAGGFDGIPMAGKTGTTQNWADAWTVGYSPYYTTAVWLGFDRGGGNSLGVDQTGAIAAGPIWGRMMRAIHADHEPIEFPRPVTGISEVEVSTRSGLLPPEHYSGSTREELFLTGSEPREYDRLEEFERAQTTRLVDRLRRDVDSSSYSLDRQVDFRLDLDLDLDLRFERGVRLNDDLDLHYLDGEQQRELEAGSEADETRFQLDAPSFDAPSEPEGNPLLD